MKRLLALVLLWAPAALAQQKLVLVVPFQTRGAVASEADKSLLLEVVRTAAADQLGALGYTVLTSENTFELLRRNGVDPTSLECQADCMLELAKKVQAEILLSGSLTKSEQSLVAYLRVFEGREGQQLSSVHVEGAGIGEVRKALEAQMKPLLSRAINALPDDLRPAANRVRRPRPGDGFLTVQSDPAAEAWVDGERVGRTPVRRLPLGSGSHALQLSTEGYVPLPQQFAVKSGEETSLTLTLSRSHAEIVIFPTPKQAGITVDGQPVAGTRAGVAAGRHKVEVSADGYETAARTVEVAEGQTQQLEVALVAKPARLVITATRNGSCEVGGHSFDVSTTTPASVDVAAGALQLQCTCPDAPDVRQPVTVLPGETVPVLVRFAVQSAGAVAREPKSGLEFVAVSGATASLGCERGDDACDDAEKPPRSERVAAFNIGRTEVTVAAYRACVDQGVCSADPLTRPGPLGNCTGVRTLSDHPVNCVTREESAAFCNWTGGRLPTGPEWEYAAKAGQRRIYAFDLAGGEVPANFCDDSCAQRFHLPWAERTARDGFPATAPVGSFPSGANAWGLLDMAGNVAEWTATEARGKAGAFEVRGGGWFSSRSSLRASAVAFFADRDWSEGIGFRCVR
jgi:iron(II)-dependent oxidoreductase